MKYHPPVRNARMRNEITSFQQRDGESLYEAWDRLKELLRQCPNHGILHWIELETFYNGLNGQTRSIIDAAANGTLLSKSFNEAYDLLERMAVNSYQWPSDRSTTARRAPGVYEVDEVAALNAKIAVTPRVF